jgi:hypothetical protein
MVNDYLNDSTHFAFFSLFMDGWDNPVRSLSAMLLQEFPVLEDALHDMCMLSSPMIVPAGTLNSASVAALRGRVDLSAFDAYAQIMLVDSLANGINFSNKTNLHMLVSCINVGVTLDDAWWAQLRKKCVD